MAFATRNVLGRLKCSVVLVQSNRSFSSVRFCKLLVVGGGTGGISVAARFAEKFQHGQVCVIEPSLKHYYQPMFTLVGGGLKELDETFLATEKVIPESAEWFPDSVVKINPERNFVITNNGLKVNYEYLVLATGLTLDFDKIPGLLSGLEMPNSGVCSNYSPKYVEKTFKSLCRFREGNLVFTFPNTPVKCAGAPQKICYLAEEHLRKRGVRDKAQIYYNTSLGVIFGVKKYATELSKICADRDIKVNLRTELMEVRPELKIALFRNLDQPADPPTEIKYSILHVTPPMSAPKVIRSAPKLADDSGFLDVHKDTLQHKVFQNVFGIGDCTNVPTSKTAAAVAAQSGVLEKNLLAVMDGKQPLETYDGYTSCPLITGSSKCILAEFDYSLNPVETFPFDQSKERSSMFHLKKSVMPHLYWNYLLKGKWAGPAKLRNALHLKFGAEKRPEDFSTKNPMLPY